MSLKLTAALPTVEPFLSPSRNTSYPVAPVTMFQVTETSVALDPSLAETPVGATGARQPLAAGSL